MWMRARSNDVTGMANRNSEGRSVRLLRVGEQVRHVLSELLQRGDVHDDTLQIHLVSVTEVRMSPDLRHATVFVKPLLGQDEEAVLKALRQNTAYLQREVAQPRPHEICGQAQVHRRRELRRRHAHRPPAARPTKSRRTSASE